MTNILVIVFLFFGLFLQAQDTKTIHDEKKNVIQDYSREFNAFYKLGLPDVSKAEYVRVHETITYLDSFAKNGNAWVLKKEEDGAPATLVIFNAATINVYDETRLLAEFKLKKKVDEVKDSEFLAENKSRIMASWENSDIKTDVDKLLSTLHDMAPEEFSEHKDQAGTLFLYAIQIYSKGFKDEANKIISRLVELAGDIRIVRLLAMNSLADQEYLTVLFELQKSGDWKKFAAQLDLLLQKYPEGWQSAASIELLLAMVRKQIGFSSPPEIKGKGINEEDRKLAESLLNLRDVPFYSSSGSDNWLFPVGDENEYQDEVIKKIMSRGRDSIPMLIALLEDDYMISSCNTWFEADHPQKIDEDIFSKLPHPFKRKDVAKALLFPIIVCREMGEHPDFHSLNDDELINICREWYDEIKNKTHDELLMYYVRNKLDPLSSRYIYNLINEDANKHAAVIDEYFLNMEKNIFALRCVCVGIPVMHYVGKRKKAALPFLEKLKARFEKELREGEEQSIEVKEDSTNDEGIVEIMWLGPPINWRLFKMSLDVFDELANEKPAKQVVDEIVSGEKNLDDYLMHEYFEFLLNRMNNNEALDLLFYGISEAGENIHVKFDLVHMLSRLRVSYLEKGNSIENWKQLIADGTMHDGYKINFLAAKAMEIIYGDVENTERMRELQNIIGNRIDPLILKRAEERLGGKPENELTPYPEIRTLNADENRKLADDLQKAAENGKVDDFMRNIGYSEFSALIMLVGENLKLKECLRNYAYRVASVECRIKGEEKALDAFKGTVFDIKGVEKIQEYCKKFMEKGKPFSCKIKRDLLFDGIYITLYDPQEYDPQALRKRKENPHMALQMDGYIKINCQDGKSMRWKKTDNGIKEDKVSLELFEQSLKKAFGDDKDYPDDFYIHYKSQIAERELQSII